MKLAFIGCGSAAKTHAKTLRRLDLGVEYYFASRSPDKAERACQGLGGAGVFANYNEALSNAAIDVIFVTTPPSNHLELTLSALEAGKDVIVEKPAFLSTAEFDTITQACKRFGKRVFVAENYHYKPLTASLRQLIEAEVIGQCLFVMINATKNQRSSGWRNDQTLCGGGALFEGGVHWINLMSSIGLDVVRAAGFQPKSSQPLERSMLVTFEYEQGPVGTLAYSWEAHATLKGIRLSKISGTEGSITFESNGLFVIVNGKSKRLIFPGLRDIAGYSAMFKDFVESWTTGRDPQMTLDMARRDIELIEQAYGTLPQKSATRAEPSLVAANM